MLKVASFLASVCTNNRKSLNKHGLYQLVTKLVTSFMKEHSIPGAAIAITDSSESYFYTFGIADYSNNKPVTNQTIFEIGSITKLFTALLFTKATNNQNMHLNDALIKHYPKLNSNPFLHDITFEKLLTHTSGLPRNLLVDIITPVQALNYLLHWKPTNTIGSKWQYSNVGIGLVGMILQNKSNKTINQLYREQILKQFGMLPIGTKVDDEFQPDFAQSYLENGKTAPHFYNANGPFPAAWGLKANIQDMSYFLQAFTAGLNISSHFKQAIQQTQIPRLAIGNIQQGLVWRIHSLQDKTLLSKSTENKSDILSVRWLPKEHQVFDANKLFDKTGAHNGFRSYVAVIPSKKLGIAILFNKSIPIESMVNIGRKIIFAKK